MWKNKRLVLEIEILNEDFPVISKVCSLLGNISSSIFEVRFGFVHYGALERDKIHVLKLKKGAVDKIMITSSAGIDDIYIGGLRISLQLLISFRQWSYTNNWCIQKHSPEACNFIKKETETQVFPCEFCKNLKNSYFNRTPSVDLFASWINIQIPKCWGYQCIYRKLA